MFPSNFNLNKEAKFLWDISVIGLALIDKEGRWLKVNRTTCNILEYTESELERKSYQELTHPEDINDDNEMRKMLITGEFEWFPMTKRFLTKTGKIIWIKLTINAVKDDEDNFICFFAQVLPIDPELLHSHTILKATDNVRKKSFTIETLGQYLSKNWMWISPIGFGIGFGIYKIFEFFWNLILIGVQHQPH